MPIRITIPGVESWDEEHQRFVYSEETVLELEHSLVSLTRWESIFEKSFLNQDEKTPEETLAYIHAMCVDQWTPGEILFRLTEDNVREINKYIESKMTATTFREIPGARVSRERITNELIRWWMVAYKIPIEYENSHLNQLLTLIRVASEKNKTPKKRSASEIAAERQALNAQRRAQMNSTG